MFSAFFYQPQHQWCVFLESWLLAHVRANQFLPEVHLILNHSLSLATNPFYCSTWNHSLVQEDTFLSLFYGTSSAPICSFSTAECLTYLSKFDQTVDFPLPSFKQGEKKWHLQHVAFHSSYFTVIRPVPVLKSQFLTHKLEEQAFKVKVNLLYRWDQ